MSDQPKALGLTEASTRASSAQQTDLEHRIIDALANGPAACVTLAAELARPFVTAPKKAAKKATNASAKKTSAPTPPAPLATFFALLATSEHVGRQDRLVAPADWAIDDGKLFFAEENQNVCEWACDVEGDDPRVFHRHPPATEWDDENIDLSAYLLRFVTFESTLCADAVSSAPCLTQAKLDAVLGTMRRLPFTDASWPEAPGRFYARGDVLAFASPNGDGVSSLFVGARTQDELAFLEPFIDDDWH